MWSQVNCVDRFTRIIPARLSGDFSGIMTVPVLPASYKEKRTTSRNFRMTSSQEDVGAFRIRPEVGASG